MDCTVVSLKPLVFPVFGVGSDDATCQPSPRDVAWQEVLTAFEVWRLSACNGMGVIHVGGGLQGGKAGARPF